MESFRLKLAIGVTLLENENNGLERREISINFIDKLGEHCELSRTFSISNPNQTYSMFFDDMIDDAIKLYDGSENLFIKGNEKC